jgi:hypothetical protein
VKTEPNLGNLETENLTSLAENAELEKSAENMGDLIKDTIVRVRKSRKAIERRGRRPR